MAASEPNKASAEKSAQAAFDVAARRRPLSVTYLALGVLTFAGIYLLRFIFSIQQQDFLGNLLPISPYYLSISGFIWLVVGVVIAAGLWFGKRWAARATQVSAFAFSAYYWIDRLLLTADGPGYNWLFSAIVNLLGLAIIYWMVSNRKARIFFGELNDR
jgi:hypothetical protein